ncbi:MAG: ATP-binding protein [Bacteriovoracaceae bacterium]
MKFFIPLRLKFLLLVFVTFSVAVYILTNVSRNLYLNDKESYIFEDMLTSVENDSNFLEAYIESKTIITRAMFSNAIIKKSESQDTQIKFPREFFLDNPAFIDYTMYRYGNKEYFQIEKVRNMGIKEMFPESTDLFKIKIKGNKTLKNVITDRIVVNVGQAKDGSPQLKIAFFDLNTRVVGLFRFALNIPLSRINTSSSYTKVLLGKSNQTLFSSDDELFSKGDDTFKANFNKLLGIVENSRSNSGVKTSKSSLGTVLFAYKKNPDLGTKYFSIVRKVDAFAGAQVLVVKMVKNSVIVFIIILFAVFFSSKGLTSSIQSLIVAAKEASKGNYQSTIDLKSGDEMSILVNSFNAMITKIQGYTEQLEEYNKTLEAQVEERTRDLKVSNDFINAMINSLDQGLFVFSRKGRILPIYTKACEFFFGTALNKKKIDQILPINDGAEFSLWIKSLFEEKIPFDSIAQLGPNHIMPFGDDVDSEEFLYVTFNYYPMRDEEEKIQYIVVVATDKTVEYRSEKRFEKQKGYVERISKMIKNKTQFITFLSEAKLNFKKAREYFDDGENVFNYDGLMRIFHSLKGIAGQYAVKDLADYVHECETNLSPYGQLGPDERKKFLPNLINNVEEMEEILQNTIRQSVDFLGESAVDGKVREEIKRETLYEFKALMSKSEIDPDVQMNFSNTFLRKPIKTYFKVYEDLVDELGKQLEKDINPIVYKDGELPVDLEYYSEFFSNCVHVFRNIMDHGIELPMVRERREKSPAGTITISFNRDDVKKRLGIQISDDGAGIDPEKIRQKLKEKGYPENVINEADDKVIEHIFDPDFSTRSEVTDVSGRGVGMDSVRSVVIELGGQVNVVSEKGKGTSFMIDLPYV